MIKQDSILDRAWLLDLEGRTQEAIELYEKSARNGNTEAMCMLGMMYYGKDPEKSIAWYEKAADLDSVDAIEHHTRRQSGPQMDGGQRRHAAGPGREYQAG